MKILSLDPGETTGFAIWDDSYDPHSRFGSWEVPGGLEGAAENLDLDVDRFVFEKFVITSQTAKKDLTACYVALDIIGYAKGMMLNSNTPIRGYAPGEKSFATDAMLKSIGWYKVGFGGHANDAARHLLKYLVDYRLLPNDLMTKIIDSELSA